MSADATQGDETETTLVETAGKGSVAASVPRDRLVPRGDSLGRYIVVDVLGAGAMGVVYRAYDPDLDRALALKLVAVSDDNPERSEREQHRLLREAQAMARLAHPNVISVFDVGVLDGAVYMAMELVDGQTLGSWRAQPGRTVDEIVRVFLAAGAGLAAAHRVGLIHRDFKPDNIMVDRADRPRVLDFGLARSVERPESDDTVETLRSSQEHSGSLEKSMTRAGVTVGTPAYMSPEQHLGNLADDKSDQFSFCVALFEALYGQRPFAGETLAALAYAVTQGVITIPDGIAVPTTVHDVVLRGLSVDSRARYASVDALLVDLRQATRRRKWRLGFSVGLLGVVLGASAWVHSATREVPVVAGPVCEGAAPKLAQVWSEARAETIATTFSQTGLSYAPDVWGLVAGELNRRSKAWVKGRTEACEATRLRGEQSEALLDRKIACFDRQLRDWEALLKALETPDSQMIRNSIDAAFALADPADCLDTQGLQDGPAPPDAAIEAEVMALRVRLGEARALYNLGKYVPAQAELEPLVTAAQQLGYAPVLAEVLQLAGDALQATSSYESARTHFERAFDAALAGRDDRRAAELSNTLAFLVGNLLAQSEAGLRHLSTARSLLLRLDHSEDLEADSWSNEGAIRVAAGQYVRGIEAHDKARAHWEAVAPEGAALAIVLDNTGGALVRLGRAEEAVPLHRRAVSIRRRLYGAQHPVTAISLRELGTALSIAQRFDEAREQLEAALVIQREARGNASTRVATLLDDLGRVLRKAGEHEQAITRHREAYAVWAAALGGPHPDLVVSGLNIGYTLSAQGRYELAFAEFKKALGVADASVGPEHAMIIYSANAAATALVELGSFDEAWLYTRRSLDLDGKVDVDPTLLAETRFTGAHALWADGKVSSATKARARQLAAKALELYQAGPPRWQSQIDQIEAWLKEH